LKNFYRVVGARWMAAVLVLCLSPSAYAFKSEAWAKSQFASAQHLHQQLEGRPAQELTRADYQGVINAYRRIYFEAPTSTKADPSVVAVAGLLEEMGRRFEDRAILQSAIKEYEFLRHQYPGSKARFGALFRIGEIYKDDLHDKQHADEAFQEFLRWYPRNQFAEEARRALATPVENAGLRTNVKREAKAKKDESDDSESADEDKNKSEKPADSESRPAMGNTEGKLVRVTGIRQWSTPGISHVAVDLQGEVKFESQRIDHPDRVFFDLLDTKLDTWLLGKSLDVDSEIVKKIRISQYKPGKTRVVLEVGSDADFTAKFAADPPRLLIDLRPKDSTTAANGTGKQVESNANSEKSDETAPDSKSENTEADAEAQDAKPRRSSVHVVTANGIKKTIVEADDSDDAPTTVATKPVPVEDKVKDPPATEPMAADVKRGRSKSKVLADTGREAQPTASGDRSLIRALGLKIGKIVIDPGHGGHDTGTIGPNGLEEKDLVLDVSKRLGKLLATRLGAVVVYTRSDDTFIPLENRTALANEEGADLFVSVHANSSRDPDARGVETYYLNFTSSPEALEVAARENAVSDKSIHELQDLVKSIALKEKIDESREFAMDVEKSLHSGLATKNAGLRDRGVKKAPFIVLIGANMPSILAEISFLSNPRDEHQLETSAYRERIAESLYRGIAKYVSGLSGVKVASKIDKTAAQ